MWIPMSYVYKYLHVCWVMYVRVHIFVCVQTCGSSKIFLITFYILIISQQHSFLPAFSTPPKHISYLSQLQGLFFLIYTSLNRSFISLKYLFFFMELYIYIVWIKICSVQRMLILLTTSKCSGK